MNPDKDILLALYISLDNSEMALIVKAVLEGLDTEMTVAAGEINIGNLLYKCLCTLAVLNESLNGVVVELAVCNH